MKKQTITKVITDALTSRGFSMAEAEQLIKRVSIPEPVKHENVTTKRIDIYV